MDLNPANADLFAAGQYAQLLPDADLRAHRGAGYDGAMALDCKGAVQRQAKDPGCAARIEANQLTGHLAAKLIESRAGNRRDRDGRRTGQLGTVRQQLDLVAYFLEPIRTYQVGLGLKEYDAAEVENM